MPRHRSPFSFAVLFVASGLAAQTPEPPPALTWQQLVARPDLWPRRCRLTKDQEHGGRTLPAGSEFPLHELKGDFAVVEIAPGIAEVRPGVTDILSVVNTAYAAMTPEQRALDLPALALRADLWPAKVVASRPIDRAGFDGKQTIDAGAELDFGSYDGTWVRARHAKIDGLRALMLTETDFVERARAALVTPVPKREHRVLRELDGKLVQATTGARKKIAPGAPPEFLLLYFSAGWCGPCQKFSPQLVRFHEKHAAHTGKRFQTVWISRDKSEGEMRQYAKRHDFPWLAVAWKDLTKVPITQAYAPLGIPDAVLLDANGAVLATSYDGNDYEGPERVLKALEERLGAGR